MQGLLADPCFVLKRQLTGVPLFGWLIAKNRQIALLKPKGEASYVAANGAFLAAAGDDGVVTVWRVTP